jgi:RNA polymerase sigma-70 factor (ECF subfamily)
VDAKNSSEIQNLLKQAGKRLLARAAETHSLTVDSILPRLSAALDKYVLRDDPNASAQAISGFIDEIQADDLCLIIACEHGDDKAWNELVERFSTTVRSAARSASSNEDAAEDLAQSIWAELYGLRTRKDGKAASKLAYYSGRGSLAGWLRAVVAQLAVDVYRKQARLVQADEDVDLDRLARETPMTELQTAVASTGQNPEEVVSNRFVEADMQNALNTAVKELAAEDRLLVKLYYFDNLRLHEAGKVLGVHEATASRRLTKVHSQLRQRVGEILISERGWTKAETERSFSEAAQYLETDLESVLGKTGV